MILIYSHETLPIAVELAALLGAGESVITATARLTRIDLDESAATCLRGAPTLVGTLATQVVSGLVAGGRYRLEFDVTVSVTKIFVVPIDINCPF